MHSAIPRSEFRPASQLAEESPPCAELVKLRFFAGLTLEEASAALGLARRTADRYWAYARARLYEMLSEESNRSSEKS